MHQDLEEEDLNHTLKSLLAIRPSPVLIIPRLKFRNTIYSVGDHILLIQNLQSNQPLYGRVLCIAKIPSLKFPVLLIAWYLMRSDPQIQEHITFRMSKKQLVLSSQTDWQYVQSVKGKLQVLRQKDFHLLEPRQKERQGIFFCRSYLNGLRQGLLPQLTRVCQCYVPFNPEESYCACVCCGAQFHGCCSKQEEICYRCSPQ